MVFGIIFALIVGGAIVYAFLNPNERIQTTEINELETLDAGYGKQVDEFIKSSNVNEKVIERYFYLKHKYNLSLNKTK